MDVERCHREIAAIEAELLAGNPDVAGLCWRSRTGTRSSEFRNRNTRDPMNRPPEPGEVFNPYRMFTGLFIPEALARSNAVSSGAKMAYGRLARYAGEDGRCFPTVSTLGKEIGVGQRQAQKYLAELEKAKLIRRIDRYVGRGQTSNEFEFLWHEIFERGGELSFGEGGERSFAPRGER